MLKLILIIVVVYLIYSLLVRVIIPSMMRKSVEDFQKRFFDQNPNADPNWQKKKEGEVSIKYTDKKEEKTFRPPDNNDDYVDFEEIKDK